jgi:predicted dehydrogenase
MIGAISLFFFRRKTWELPLPKQYRVGIAGYGVVGPRRRRFIDLHPNLKTVAVCDKALQQNGAFPDGVRFYTNYKDLLGEDLDILFVCLTHDIAPEVTMAGLEKGLHVFCEKPPGRTVGDIKKVIEVEKKHPALKLKYGFNHRYHDSIQEALKIIDSKELGTLINMRGIYGKSHIAGRDNAWRSKRDLAGGGILLDQGIHMLDLMLLFANEPFVDVRSFVSNDYWNHDVEDNAYALMKTKSGVVGMLHSSATQWRHRFFLEISLTEGSLILSGILSGSKSYGQETLTVAYRKDYEEMGNPKEMVTNYVRDNSWKQEIDEFADAVINDKPISVGSSQHALEAMSTVYRIYCSDPSWAEKYNIHID